MLKRPPQSFPHSSIKLEAQNASYSRLNQMVTKNWRLLSKRNGLPLGTIPIGHSLLSHITFDYRALYYLLTNV